LIIAASIGALHRASQHFAFIARCLQWTSRENRQCEDVHQSEDVHQTRFVVTGVLLGLFLAKSRFIWEA
jgi:hypothetical protein